MLGTTKGTTVSLSGRCSSPQLLFLVYRLNSVPPSNRHRGCRGSPTSMNDRGSGTDSRWLPGAHSASIRARPVVSHKRLSDALCLTAPSTEAYSAVLSWRCEGAKGFNDPKTQTIGSHAVALPWVDMSVPISVRRLLDHDALPMKGSGNER